MHNLEELNAALAGRYQVRELLGRGGMATVWLAHDPRHDRLVALKLLRPELAVSLGPDRFSREIAIVAKLNHPHILGVLDSGVVRLAGVETPFFAMPHVEGFSLATRLEGGAPLPVSESLRLAAQVADALAFAHARGVVHRDIKPGNILIQAGHALVCDFGVAVALDAAGASRRTSTQAGQVLGTPLYMSPEQAGGGQVDGRSDIYSLGCVLYEMLAGGPPFMADTPQAVLAAHLAIPPPPIQGRRPDLSDEVASVVHHALAKDPATRYATAADFRDALEQERLPVITRRAWWPAAVIAGSILAFAIVWLRPWRPPARAPARQVVLLEGFSDPSGRLRAESAALTDALRLELQAVPELRVVDASSDGAAGGSSRRESGADLLLRGTLDWLGDSVGATLRLLDARDGSEIRSAVAWDRDAAALRRRVVAPVASSLFGRIRSGLDSLLAEQRVLALGGDSVTRDLRQRARGASGRSVDALLAVGPRRMLEEVALADSLLALAGAREPTSALPAFERARLGEHLGFILMAARQFFPDSAWLPAPATALEAALTHADVAVGRAPWSADVWLARSGVYGWLYSETEVTSWRDSALADLQKATSLAGMRPDVWNARAGVEIQAGRWREALYSAEQGQQHDHLSVNAEELQYRKARAELMLQDFAAARTSCRSGANDFPGSEYFITCEAEVLGRSSADSSDAGRLLALADSLDGTDAPLPPMIPAELRLFAAAVLARAGRGDSAVRIFGGVVETWGARIDPVLLLDAVYVRDVMGDADSALALAARAVREDPTAAQHMERSPWYQHLRGHPGFAAALGGIPPVEARGR